MSIKAVFAAVSAAALVATMSAGSVSADFPEKPIKLYVGFAAGGGTDISARGFASYVNQTPSMNGMPMVVVNKPGGSGLQAAKVVADSRPDGYTLHIINSATFATGKMSSENAPVDPRSDFTALGCMTRLVTALQVNTKSPYQDAKALVDAFKESGETFRWATSGATTLHSLIGHLFLDEVGIKHQAVPFKGGSEARNTLVANKVDGAFNGVHLQAGFETDIKSLAVPLKERDPANPDIPTFGELGLPDLDVAGLMCVWGPKDMDATAVTKIQEAIKEVVEIEGFQKFLAQSDLAAFYSSPEQQVADMDFHFEKLGPIVARVMN